MHTLPWPSFSESWGWKRRARLSPIRQTLALTHRGPEGRSGGRLHAVLFPPWDTLPPRATQMVFWRGGKGPKESWGRGCGTVSPSLHPGPEYQPPPSVPQHRPHLPPGKQQEEQRRRRGWRWEGGGKEPEPEPPDGVGVGGLKPMAGTGSQQWGIVSRVSKTSLVKTTHGPRRLSCLSPTQEKGLAWGGKG